VRLEEWGLEAGWADELANGVRSCVAPKQQLGQTSICGKQA